MKPIIRLSGVSRSFGRKDVLRGITATAAEGKVIGLLGRNGEGKTTLFQIMLDMLTADEGQVEVLGLRPNGSGSIRQRVGYIPEKPAFHDFMNVMEVFQLRARFFQRWNMEQALDLARQMDLDVRTKIKGASKGTLAKAAWICAAAHGPELFLMDEPTSGLDALVRDDILNHLLDELHDKGRTILVANHRMEELSGVLDEVWVLSGGVISGVHDVDALRTQACRITGRLKAGASIPQGIPIIALSMTGPLAEWATFEASAAERLMGSGVLESVEKAPLPLDIALKLLLKKGAAHA